ncbi:MAG: hypothetical protein ACTS80_00490 [Candidatus Hodgkinia cicadicola]
MPLNLFKALITGLTPSSFYVNDLRFTNLVASKTKSIVNCVSSALTTIGIIFRRKSLPNLLWRS